jgi:hypothetical protein
VRSGIRSVIWSGVRSVGRSGVRSVIRSGLRSGESYSDDTNTISK